jgi:hypothetical protein
LCTYRPFRSLEHFLVQVNGGLAVLHLVDLLALGVGHVQRALVVDQVVELLTVGDGYLLRNLAGVHVDDHDATGVRGVQPLAVVGKRQALRAVEAAHPFCGDDLAIEPHLGDRAFAVRGPRLTVDVRYVQHLALRIEAYRFRSLERRLGLPRFGELVRGLVAFGVRRRDQRQRAQYEECVLHVRVLGC